MLAPAGSPEAFRAALCGGADEIYLGLDQFNARHGAENFSLDNLGPICDEAHLRGVTVNLTLNTLIFDDELDACVALAGRAWQAGVDAFIVADVGLITRLRHQLPAARIHCSTQLSLSDEADVRAAAGWGAARVTLARELTLAEITHLCAVAREVGVEVEVFAHGALCVCYSGQCLLSSMIGGRSANRGRCAQACRLPYALLGDGDRPLATEGEHMLSPKDLCLVDELAALDAAGVASIKIEGRMKSAEYVRTVTGVYRQALDRVALAKDDPTWKASALSVLEEAFSRGFTTGLFSGTRSNAMMSYDRPNNRGVAIGRIQGRDHATVTLKLTRPIAAGDRLEVWTRSGRIGYTVPSDFDGASSRCSLPSEGDLSKVGVGDRVFRVRSAALAFVDEEFEPRIPIAGLASYRRDEQLQMTFWPAAVGSSSPVLTSEDPAAPDIDHAISRRLAARWGEFEPRGQALGPVAAPAKTKELTAEDFRTHIDRLGQTPFRLTDLDIELDRGLGIGFSTIHHVRSDALTDLADHLSAPWKKRPGLQRWTEPSLARAETKSCVVVAIATSAVTARAALAAGADEVLTPAEWLLTGEQQVEGQLDLAPQEAFPDVCIPILGPTVHDLVGSSREHRRGFNPYELIEPGHRVVVNSLGELRVASDRAAAFEVGTSLPLLNRTGLHRVARLGADRVWLSPELRLDSIESLAACAPVPLGITVIGAERLMVTEHCIVMGEGPCDERCEHCRRRQTRHGLRDRKGYRFPVITDPLGRSHLYNGVPLDIVPWIGPLMAAGVSAFAVDTTLLSAEETRRAVERVRQGITNARQQRPALEKAPATTTGHLFRGPA